MRGKSDRHASCHLMDAFVTRGGIRVFPSGSTGIPRISDGLHHIKCHMCHCATLPDIIYWESRPAEFESMLIELSTGNWIKLFRCSECQQLWRVDEWDKYQVQFAVKVPSVDGWETFDAAPLEKLLLLQSRGGTSNNTCAWAHCGKPAMMGVAFCVDHLYETGARK